MRCANTKQSKPKEKEALFLYELDDGHLGVVALPRRCADDSGVAAGAFSVPLGSRLEQGVHELLVVDVSQRLLSFRGPGGYWASDGLIGDRGGKVPRNLT